jgi:hypothetical protein
VNLGICSDSNKRIYPQRMPERAGHRQAAREQRAEQEGRWTIKANY